MDLHAIDPVAAIVASLVGLSTMSVLRAFTQPFPKGVYVPPNRGGLLGLLKGHIHEMAFEPAYSWQIRMLSKMKETGNVCIGHRIVHFRRIILTDPRDMEYILQDPNYNWTKGPGYAALANLIGRGLLSLVDDNEHSLHRREMASAFSPLALKTIANTTVRDHAKQLVEVLNAVAKDSNPSRRLICFQNLISLTTLNVISEAAFHTQPEETITIAKAFSIIQGGMNVWQFVPFYRSVPTRANRTLWRYRAEFRNLASKIAQRVLKQGKPADGSGKALIDYLVFSEVLTEKDIGEHSLTFMVAGHETSATALTWITFVLSRDLEAQDRLYEELCSIIGKDTYCEVDDLKNCRYAFNVVREVLRLYPPASQVSRRPRTDDVLPGSKTFIPADVDCVCPFYLNHHSKEIWGEDAELFRPERWDDPNLESKIGSMGFTPFGVGRRNCIGKDFAMNEVLLLLAVLYRNFRFSWPADEADPGRRFSVVMRPQKKFHVHIEARQ
jgi:cytochrome P450